MLTDKIKKIEQAAKIGDLAFKFILTKIKKGISEKQLALKLKDFIKKQGAQLAFPSIVAFGENSSEVHHKTGNRKLKLGDIIMLDFGAKINGYCSDMTRMVFFGKPTAKQKKIFQIVLTAQKKAIKFINSQSKIKAVKVDKIARDYIIAQGYPDMPHSLGHGIGLKVHEQPRLSAKSKAILKDGMVFSIEPGIYLKDWGGVRIEDLFVLEKGKLRQITLSPVQPKLI